MSSKSWLIPIRTLIKSGFCMSSALVRVSLMTISISKPAPIFEDGLAHPPVSKNYENPQPLKLAKRSVAY